MGIKQANWRYWILVLQHPETKEWQDYMLLAHGAKINQEFQTWPFLLGCVVCGEPATQQCSEKKCREKAIYCNDVGSDKKHKQHWNQHVDTAHKDI